MTLLTALYMSVLKPEDRVAVKPHASPVFHAIQYLFGRQSRDQLERFARVASHQDIQADPTQNPFDRAAVQFLVVDDEHVILLQG